MMNCKNMSEMFIQNRCLFGEQYPEGKFLLLPPLTKFSGFVKEVCSMINKQ